MITVSVVDKDVTISLGSKFDYESIMEFKESYSKCQEVKKVTIDFRDTEYMDSSGLGMLINMRNDMADAAPAVQLINCRPQVKKVLMISRFDKYFNIS